MTGTTDSSARIPARVKGLSLVSLFNDFASEMVYPLLPAFVTSTLGAGAVALGVLDGAADLASSLLKWVSGRLADRPGWRRPLILGGYLLAVVLRPVMALASSAWQVIGLRVGDRIGKGFRGPPRDALIADVTHPGTRGRAFGFQRGADHLGAVLGSLLAWALLQSRVPVRDVLAWSAAPGAVAFVVLYFVLRGYRVGSVAQRAAASDRKDATGRVFWGPVLLLAALTLFRLPETLLLLRLQDLGVAVPLIPLAWAGLHVVRSVGSYPGGWLSDRIGPRITEALGGATFALVVFLLGMPLHYALAITVFLCLGIVAGLTETAERSLVANLSPVRTGRGFGAYHAVTGLAALPAGLAFGELYQRMSGHAAAWASAGAMAVAVLVWVGFVARGGDG